MKSTLKAPGCKLLKLEQDKLLSNFAFNFNLRCYSKCAGFNPDNLINNGATHSRQGLTLVPIPAQHEVFCPVPLNLS